MLLWHMRVFLFLLAALPLFAGDAHFVRSERVCTRCDNTVADINGDGLDDLIELLGNRQIRFNLGGSFAEPVPLAGFKSNESAVVWGDFNGDGFADVIVHPLIDLTPGPDRLLTGDGFGRFRSVPYAFGAAGHVVKAADADGDGKLDLVVESKDGELFLLRNDGGASFERLSWTAPAPPRGVAFGDFDGDGAFDIVEVRDNSLWFTYGNGLSGGLFVGVQPHAIQTADTNGDGRLDIVLDEDASRHSYGITVLFGDGSGRFPKSTRVRHERSDFVSIAGDFFVGGGAELALNQGGTVVVYSASGDRLHEIARYETEHANAYAIASGNFTDDARPELLADISFMTNASEEYVLLPVGFVSSRQRAVRGAAEPDRISGAWLPTVESDCALPEIGALSLVRRGVAVELQSPGIRDAAVAYVAGDETLVMRFDVEGKPSRQLYGELHVFDDGTIAGRLVEDYTPCTMRQGSHRITLTRLNY
jgi:hypothetical protein